MSKNALAVSEIPSPSLQKSKPRYTEAENKILFDSWWNPQKRRELVKHLGRNMSALRSQFCRLLKEKGITNQEYYNMMQSKYANETGSITRKRSREIKDIDRLIIDTFSKHQALGNSRAQACEELQQKLGDSFTSAALKLRFYRLIKRLQYEETDLLNIGKELLGEATPSPAAKIQAVKSEKTTFVKDNSIIKTEEIQNKNQDNLFFFQLSSLPNTIQNIEERISEVEEKQRHQLDLRGFIEHLLAVERDLKREDKLMEEIQRLIDENESLKNMMDKERERLKKREEELSSLFKMLDTMLSDFMRLESVSKLASLGDFMHRLEITVDQFGNVLKSRRVNG